MLKTVDNLVAAVVRRLNVPVASSLGTLELHRISPIEKTLFTLAPQASGNFITDSFVNPDWRIVELIWIIVTPESQSFKSFRQFLLSDFAKFYPW